MPKPKKNKYLLAPQAELDLHGLTLAEAQTAVAEFFREARALNYRLVRIITGKGASSASGPVLKPWLEGHLSHRDYDWRWAKISEGGEGAFDIKL